MSRRHGVRVIAVLLALWGAFNLLLAVAMGAAGRSETGFLGTLWVVAVSVLALLSARLLWSGERRSGPIAFAVWAAATFGGFVWLLSGGFRMGDLPAYLVVTALLGATFCYLRRALAAP